MGFEDLKKRISEEKTEVFYPENEFLKLEVFSAEKILYEENAKLADVIFEEFNALINGEVELDSIEEKSEELMEKLSPQQQGLLRNIIKSIMNGGDIYLDGLPSNYKGDTLQDKYKKRGVFQAVDYFYAGVSEKVRNKIKREDIRLTPWGAVVVSVNDEEIWKELYDPKGEKSEDAYKFSQGFIKNNIFERQVDSSVDNYPFINAQFKRTIYVRIDNINQERAMEIERHELFHELYNNVISKHQEIRYRRNSEKNLFEEIKNESIAYLLSNNWEYGLNSLSSSVRGKNSQSSSIEEAVGCLYEIIVDSRLKEKLQQDNPEKFQIMMAINNEDLKLISEEEEESIKRDSLPFLREIVYFLREIIRLKYLESDKFEEAAKVLLTAQSFKEMRYKLSKIEEDKKLEPSIHVDLEGLDQEGNLNMAASFMYKSIFFRLPVKNIDELVNALKKRREEIKNSEKKIDRKHVKWIDEDLEYFEKERNNIVVVE